MSDNRPPEPLTLLEECRAAYPGLDWYIKATRVARVESVEALLPGGRLWVFRDESKVLVEVFTPPRMMCPATVTDETRDAAAAIDKLMTSEWPMLVPNPFDPSPDHYYVRMDAAARNFLRAARRQTTVLTLGNARGKTLPTSAPATHQPVVAVDFDGVIHGFTTPFEHALVIADPPVPGAIEWLGRLLDSGWRVILHTARLTSGVPAPLGHEQVDVTSRVAAIRTWFLLHGGLLGGETFDRLEVWTAGGKPHADVYVDDKALRYEGGMFPTVEHLQYASVSWAKRPKPRSAWDDPAGFSGDALRRVMEEARPWSGRRVLLCAPPEGSPPWPAECVEERLGVLAVTDAGAPDLGTVVSEPDDKGTVYVLWDDLVKNVSASDDGMPEMYLWRLPTWVLATP